MVVQQQLMIESRISFITAFYTAQAVYHSGAVHASRCSCFLCSSHTLYSHSCKPKLARITQVSKFDDLRSRAAQTVHLVDFTVRKSSSCACDNRADYKDHVACGSCAAREVSMSCNPKLSYLAYLIHFAHPAQLVALEWSRILCRCLYGSFCDRTSRKSKISILQRAMQ
jgi:hypothetical protein